MSLNPIPEDFTIKFTPGLCGICEEKLDIPGLFCSNCLPPKSDQNTGISLKDQLNLLANMVNSLPERDLTEYLPPNHEGWNLKDGPPSFLGKLLEPDIISNIDTGIIGYIRSNDLFLGDDILWIMANTIVVFTPDLYHTVQVKKDNNGIIEAVYSTVDKNAIYAGYPDESNSGPSLIVHLVTNF